MYSLQYYITKTRGLRRILKWFTKYKINGFKRIEDQRRQTDPKDLTNFEKKIFSQNGEDGILEEIFRRINVTNRFFVEFGVEDGSECNCRALLENRKWQGLWIDGDVENVEKARKRFRDFPIKILRNFITRDNIVGLFQESQVPQEFDLLSIDIDGNDYWIWNELKEYRPRVVAIEYNASIGPEKHWIMPYNSKHVFDGTSNFGASLNALADLGAQLGYQLVGCDSRGVNAFFVRNDLVTKEFSNTSERPSYHYSCPKYMGLSFGHPKGKGPWIQK